MFKSERSGLGATLRTTPFPDFQMPPIRPCGCPGALPRRPVEAGSPRSDREMALLNGPTACRAAGLKTGGLGMMAIGFCFLAIVRQGASPNISRHERIAPTLCAYGLIATLVSVSWAMSFVIFSGQTFISIRCRPERTCGSRHRASASSSMSAIRATAEVIDLIHGSTARP